MKTLFLIHKEIEEKHDFFPKNGPMEKIPLNDDFFAKPFPKDLFEHKHPKPPMFPINKTETNKLLKKYDLEISEVPYKVIKEKGKFIASDMFWELYEYKGYKYFYKNDKFETLLIKDTLKMDDKTKYLLLLTVLFNITFIIFYIFLVRKLHPLQKLKNNIIEFSKGNLNINTKCEGKDEISAVSNEFNNAIKEIRELTESRNLFLRNIMHELKTPITKGSLVSDMMDEGKYRDSLKRVFSRLQYLLHEFAKIEQLTSKNIKLHKGDYRIIDIIDQAIDILLIEKDKLQFDIQQNLIVHVDFQLFALALKNLIDNGIKYGKSPVLIELKDNSLRIITKGKKLEKEFEEYLRPFNRKYETSSQSLGLGLYIVENILKVHNLTLRYTYVNNENIFYINF